MTLKARVIPCLDVKDGRVDAAEALAILAGNYKPAHGMLG